MNTLEEMTFRQIVDVDLNDVRGGQAQPTPEFQGWEKGLSKPGFPAWLMKMGAKNGCEYFGRKVNATPVDLENCVISSTERARQQSQVPAP